MKSALLKATVLSAGIAASMTLVGLQPASAAGFTGDYDLSFWGLENFDATGVSTPPITNGGVDTTGAPSSITIYGGNGLGNPTTDPGNFDSNGDPLDLDGDGAPGVQGNTFFGTTLAGSIASYVSFDWAYDSFDNNPEFDSFGIFFGADPLTYTYVSLAGGVSGPAGPVADSYSFLVNPGDFFGFYVETADNAYGEGFATISNFNVNAVPTPALLPGLIGMGVAALRKKQAEAEESEA